jgi:hypothetical protein
LRSNRLEGLEEAAPTDLDPVGNTVQFGVEAGQLGVEAGQSQRPLVHVRGNHVTSVGGEVQRKLHRLAHCELGQRGRGRTDPEHVVGSDPGRATVVP